MDHIQGTLYLGSWEDATNPGLMGPALGSLLNLSERQYLGSLPTLHQAIPDEVFLAPWIWQGLLTTLAHLRREHPPVLVHCRLGVSRSPALVAAYLAWTGVYANPEKALAYVQQQRACVRVHPATWKGVLQWWSPF